MAEKRVFLKRIYAAIAKKEYGGLPKVLWSDFKVSKAGFTDDILNQDLLRRYR